VVRALGQRPEDPRRPRLRRAMSAREVPSDAAARRRDGDRLGDSSRVRAARPSRLAARPAVVAVLLLVLPSSPCDAWTGRRPAAITSPRRCRRSGCRSRPPRRDGDLCGPRVPLAVAMARSPRGSPRCCAP
jgi:hypothetical protein